MAIDSTSPRTRRAILLGALGGVAASVATAVGRAAPVAAHDADDVRLGGDNSPTGTTYINMAVADTTALVVYAEGTGIGVWGQGVFGVGVGGVADDGIGVLGNSQSNVKPSIYGLKSVPNSGPAVKGENKELTNGYAAVYGLTNGSGPGLFGENTKAGNGASGVARGTGSGVCGQSDNGRGGPFYGKKAQLYLQPSAAATHPAVGARGDLFVDKPGRLWFCKGATWKQLA